MKIAFLGVGTMGGPMARNLIKAGHELAVYDVGGAALAAFRGEACRLASSPEDAARGADVAITMLPDSADVRAALLGEQGACRALPAGKLVIDMAATSRRISRSAWRTKT